MVTTYTLAEVAYLELADMIQEAKAARAFLPFKGDREPFLDSMGQMEGFADYHFFLFLRDQSDPVGFAVILPHKEDKVVSIGPVYVREQLQGRGLGRRLIGGLIEWAKAREVKALFTQTWGGNTRARRLLEDLGFQFLREKPDTRVDGDSTVQYLLEVNNPPAWE